MATSLDEAEARWSKRSLEPTTGGVPKWEAKAQDVADGVRTWSAEFTQGLANIGARPGERTVEKYLTGSVNAATKRKYSQGVEDAAKAKKWRAGFLAGVGK